MPYASATNGDDAGVIAVKSSYRFRDSLLRTPDPDAVPIDFVTKDDWSGWFDEQPSTTQSWLRTLGHEKWSKKGGVMPIPSSSGSLEKVVVPISADKPPIWDIAKIPGTVPKGHSYVVNRDGGLVTDDIEFGWSLGTYAYQRYKTKKDDESGNRVCVTPDEKRPRLVSTKSTDSLADTITYATYLVRDIITTPAEDFGPAQLESAARALADFETKVRVVTGDDLLTENFPQVHTVGRAATEARAPRVIELVWNENAEKTITLVGKGVCYDTGGLSLKPTRGMITMKKDLGGAAIMLGLFSMLKQVRVNARVRVLIGAVENSVSGDAYRPGDILTARNGQTTLNVNSDAEGRLVLADCLCAAVEESPEIVIDAATLTGAQRVALGTDIPGIFCNSDEVATELCATSVRVNDLLWRLPLHDDYRKGMETNIADIKSSNDGPFGGAITAALYLKEFVADTPWVHVDVMAYNSSSRPGRPEGGEAQGMRALFHYLYNRFGVVKSNS